MFYLILLFFAQFSLDRLFGTRYQMFTGVEYKCLMVFWHSTTEWRIDGEEESYTVHQCTVPTLLLPFLFVLFVPDLFYLFDSFILACLILSQHSVQLSILSSFHFCPDTLKVSYARMNRDMFIL